MLRVHADRSGTVAKWFDLAKLAHMASVVVGVDDVEHVSLSDGEQCLRLDILSGTFLHGPVSLQFPSSEADDLAVLARSLSVFAFLLEHRRFPALPRGHASFARRQAAYLRTYDALLASASQREIAMAFFGHDRVGAEWNGRSDAMRSHIRRLCNAARHLAGGGYQALALG